MPRKAESKRHPAKQSKPKPKKAKRPPSPEAAPPHGPDMAALAEELNEASNAPRDWPPPTVAAELMATGEKGEPGFAEGAKDELRRRRMVPVTTLMRQNNEISYNPGDPEELEITMEKLGYYTPEYLSMEMEYERSHREGFSEAHRRKECAQQHDRALRMREVDPTLPAVPAFTDNLAVDEAALWQWCIDAQAQAKAPGDAKPVAAEPQADKPELDDEARLRVRVGGTWHDISDEAMRMLRILFKAEGAWVTGSTISRENRPDKTRKRMPSAVSAIIESHRRHGYRIPSLLPQ